MYLKNPKHNTQFKNYSGRLALFHAQNNHRDYWKQYWTEGFFENLIGNVKKGKLNEFELYGLPYLKKSDYILEAGCGPAHIVLGLNELGYTKTAGIDYEKQVVEKVNKFLPDLNVTVGDIFAIDLPSETINVYLSFGVVEHFEEGPDKALAEANRVLKNDGIAMISVPYLNPLRKKFFKNLPTASLDNNLYFHQYYFDKDEFTLILERNGFKVIRTFPYACEAFLIRETPFFSNLWRSSLMRNKIKSILRKLFYYAPSFMRKRYGHICMFICKKGQ